jgi:F0F1-type ATP synthase assembly protein I
MRCSMQSAGDRMKMDRGLYRQFGRYMTLATLLPAATFVGYAIGYLLDRWLATNFLYLVFLLLGIASGILQLVRELMKDNGGASNQNL